MDNIRKFLEEIKIYDCGMTKIRIGNDCDGGYIALKELCKKTDRIYSFGVGDDVGFELDFVNRFPDAEIGLFDHTIDSLPVDHPRFNFFKNGVGPGHIDLEDIIFTLDDMKILLKMDIEWGEWDTFLSTGSDYLNRFDQLLVEFHIVSINDIPNSALSLYFKRFYKSVYDKLNNELFGKYHKVMKKLNNQFYIFHAHANNSLPKICVGGYEFPPLLELSFVKKDLVNDVRESNTKLPVEGLDYPNKPYKNDIRNWFPLIR